MNSFVRAWFLLTLCLVFLLGYEALHPYLPAGLRSGMEPTHFWTTHDSLAIGADSSQAFKDLMAADSLPTLPERDSFRVLPPDSLALVVPELDNYNGLTYLSRYFEALRELKAGRRKRVRIAYFGDSTTQGDLCVGVLRHLLQQRYGGEGVGFVPISGNSSVRTTIKQYPDEKAWIAKHYFRRETDVRFRFGLSGDYYTGEQGRASVRFQAVDSTLWPSYARFRQAHLFYGAGGKRAAKLHCTVDDHAPSTYALDDTAAVNRLSLLEQPCTRLLLQFDFAEQQPVYGVSFESERGIFVDNLAKRNDTGGNLPLIRPEVWLGFQEHMQYDLIILHYGPNILSSRVTDYSVYEERLINTIAYLRRLLPQTDLLIVGNPDKTSRLGGQLQTDPAVYALIKSQQKAAARTGSGFFHLFRAMGGAGTMQQWAEMQPPRVVKDFVHFTHEGSQVVGGLLFDFLKGEEK